jgi:hypothetical protein
VVNGSPIDQLLGAIDELDVEAATSLLAPDCRILTVDGRRVEGTEPARELVLDFLAMVRSTTHSITAQWHQDNVWIAEVDASYELRSSQRIDAIPCAFVVQDGPDGIADLRVYAAREPTLLQHAGGEEGLRIGGRWMPPL